MTHDHVHILQSEYSPLISPNPQNSAAEHEPKSCHN